MTADELDNFMQSLRDSSASPVDRHVNGCAAQRHVPTTLDLLKLNGKTNCLRACVCLLAACRSYRTHAPESRRSYTPIQSSHEIGWDLAPLSKPGPYSIRNRQKCMRKSCNGTPEPCALSLCLCVSVSLCPLSLSLSRADIFLCSSVRMGNCHVLSYPCRCLS